MQIMIAYDAMDGSIFDVARVRTLPDNIKYPFKGLGGTRLVLTIDEPGEDLRDVAELWVIKSQFRVDIESVQLVPQ